MKQRGAIPIGLIIYAGIAVALVLALYGLYRHGVTTGEANVQTRWDKAVRDQRAKEEKQGTAAATKLEEGNAKSKTVYRTITRTVDRYIDREVYRNVCFDADGLRDANAALRGPGADPAKPDKPVPGHHPALRWDRGERIAKAD